jgi:acyl CoA:acetate/3-ketoacid CoA transferase alpha subunit
MIASYVGENKEFVRQYLSGELEVELHPAGHARRTHACRRRRGKELAPGVSFDEVVEKTEPKLRVSHAESSPGKE